MLSELEQNLIKEGEEVSGASCSGGYVGTASEGDEGRGGGGKAGKRKRRPIGPLGRFLTGRKGHASAAAAIPEAVEENSV
jgi:hypothetical protein